MSSALSSFVRRPAVAGYFYPAEADQLTRQIDAMAAVAGPAIPARGVIVPHGSYRHAGRVMGATFGQITIPSHCIILGPSHTGSLRPWSIMDEGAYRTPLGDVPVDERCAEALTARCPFLEPDPWAQRGEHAIEVVLPWLQRLGPADLTIVPLIAGTGCEEELPRLAQALAQAIRMQEEPVLLIASSDFSQYQNQAQGAAQDRLLLEAICALDEERLSCAISAGEVSMCGSEAVRCTLAAAARLGASQAACMAYGTSLDGGGDPWSVTGYAGVAIS